MSLLKKSLKILKSIGQQFALAVTDISDGLKYLVKRPLRDFKVSQRKKSKQKRQRWWINILLWPVLVLGSLVGLIGRIFLSPAELLVGLANRKRSQILWAFPGLVALIVLGLLTYGWLNSDSKLAELRNSAFLSFENRDFEAAASQYELLNESSSDPVAYDQLRWAIALFQIGETDKAMALLGQLAPGPGKDPGYDEAHQFVAVSMASQMKKPPDPVSLRTLRWHLDCGGSTQAPEVNRAWAEYFLAINQPETALPYMTRAAEVKPEFMLIVADIYDSLGKKPERQYALEKAENFFRELVANNPTVAKHRIMLARILVDLNQWKSAEEVLLEAGEVTKDPQLRRAVAEFYLTQYRRDDVELTFDDRFELLNQALIHDSNHIPVYDELIQFYRTTDDEANRNKIVNVLQEMIQSEDSAALAHFAISNVFWVDNKIEQAQQHMEQAFALDKRFSIVANNLAWLLSDSENPDLERAFSLADQVVKNNPGNGRFRDTLATILMKQKRYDEALAEFQKALPTIPNKKPVHQKMAEIYRAMNRLDLAEGHQQRADAEK